jgi:hypothetical protein
MLNTVEGMEEVTTNMLRREVRNLTRTSKWCTRCSRIHNGRCNLVEVERTSKVRLKRDGSYRRGGNKVTRLVHPEEE